jgi:uncharacterized membrane protein YgdD (TMEM256/DUF423 family)
MTPASLPARLLAALGALYCAIAVGLAAYAAHAATGAARERLDSAVLLLFVHGLALVALRPQLRGRLRTAAAAVLAVGVSLFAGSVAAAALFGSSSWPAPYGGSLLIIGWLLLAAGLLRRADWRSPITGR